MLAHLADVSIRSLLLALIAALALSALRRRRTAALQHAVWTAVVGGMLALFMLGAALPRMPLRVLTSPIVPSAAVALASPVLEALPAQGNDLPAPAPVARSIDWSEVALYAYAAITFVFLARFLTGIYLVRKLLAKSATVGDFRESALFAVPLTVGWLRPKILLPLEWREWDREKLDAVLAHEGAHVRRRDGLVAALAGINRCIFWFHPLAWLLERKLTLLAELACDESCVATVGNRESYARLLLDMARVVDGAHGRLQSHALTMAAPSHIRQRIDSILQEGRTFSRGLTWAGWATVALCGIPVVLGAGAVTLDRQPPLLQQAMTRLGVPVPPLLLVQEQPVPAVPAPRPTFEVASIRPSTGCDAGVGRGGGGGSSPSPGRLTVRCGTVASLIRDAYVTYANGLSRNSNSVPIEGGPAWINSDRYDINAKPADKASQEMMSGPMLQGLLEDRFMLKIHRETREVPSYELTVAKGGLKLKSFQVGSCTPLPARDLTKPPAPRAKLPAGQRYCGALGTPKGPNMALDIQGMSLDDFSKTLSLGLDRPVVNKTGITGMFDFHLEYAPDEVQHTLTDQQTTPTAPSIFTAVQEQLGLRLVPAKGSAEFLVIDHVERPSEN